MMAQILPLNMTTYADVLDEKTFDLWNKTGIDNTSLISAIAELREAGVETAAASQSSAEPAELAAINRRLMLTERAFLNEDVSPVAWFWYAPPPLLTPAMIC